MKFFIAILLSLFVHDLYAQDNFASVKLNELSKLLPPECKNPGGQTKVFTCHSGQYDLDLKSIADKGQIIHLGINLFGKDEMRFYPEEVYYFLERYFLEMMLTRDLGAFFKRTGEQKIEAVINGQKLAKINSLNRKSILTILKNAALKEISHDSLNYSARLSDGNNQILLTFPANNNVICGMDKHELDRNLESLLIYYKSKELPEPIKNKDFLKVEDFYTLKGESFYKTITSDLYFEKINDDYRLLCDRHYLKESLANMFLAGCNNPEKQIGVQHFQYGKKISRYDIYLKDFTDFFRSRNCKLYIGIEHESVDTLQATMVIRNPFLNYVNIVYINTTEDFLFDKTKKINVKLYSNIPCDNIKDLFGIYIDKGISFY